MTEFVEPEAEFADDFEPLPGGFGKEASPGDLQDSSGGFGKEASPEPPESEPPDEEPPALELPASESAAEVAPASASSGAAVGAAPSSAPKAKRSYEARCPAELRGRLEQHATRQSGFCVLCKGSLRRLWMSPSSARPWTASPRRCSSGA